MSIWNKDNKERKINKLNQNITVDTLIIGAGMTGLTTAYLLKNKNICVVDASYYGHGVTIASTAKITYLQGVYNKIIKKTNEHAASIYLKSQRDAIKQITEIIKKEKIECDLENVPSYLFASSKKDIKPLKEEITFLRKNGITIKEGKLPNKITSYKSFYVNDTYIFNPLKYLDGLFKILNKDIPIYEQTRILKIDRENNYYVCYSNQFYIKAKNVIVACHYPFFLYPFFLPLKSSIEKSYMVVSKVKNNGNYNCISLSKPTYSCRFYQDKSGIYQISLSESHNTAVKQNDKYHFDMVKKIFKLNKTNIIMEYSNVDIMTPDYMPYIGKIRENMYVATGYNTWGMTNSILASMIISNLINKKENNYHNIFNPKRKNILMLPYYILTQIKSFFGPKIIKNKSWYPDNIYIKNGLGIYIDKNLKKHIVYNKCPHMGCSLIFNEKEKTWDCPCHSSRFNIDGKCIKGPSKYDISYNNKLS